MDIFKTVERNVEQHLSEQSEKPRVTIEEPTYKELICWCKLNIKELLQIAYADTDRHIEEHYGGEQGLLAVIEGYIHLIEELGELQKEEARRDPCAG